MAVIAAITMCMTSSFLGRRVATRSRPLPVMGRSFCPAAASAGQGHFPPLAQHREIQRRPDGLAGPVRPHQSRVALQLRPVAHHFLVQERIQPAALVRAGLEVDDPALPGLVDERPVDDAFEDLPVDDAADRQLGFRFANAVRRCRAASGRARRRACAPSQPSRARTQPRSDPAAHPAPPARPSSACRAEPQRCRAMPACRAGTGDRVRDAPACRRGGSSASPSRTPVARPRCRRRRQPAPASTSCVAAVASRSAAVAASAAARACTRQGSVRTARFPRTSSRTAPHSMRSIEPRRGSSRTRGPSRSFAVALPNRCSSRFARVTATYSKRAAFARNAAPLQQLDPAIDRIGIAAVGFHRRQHDASVRPGDARPAQQLAILVGQVALQRRHDDRVELETLRRVDRHHLDTRRAGKPRVREQSEQLLLEPRHVVEIPGRLRSAPAARDRPPHRRGPRTRVSVAGPPSAFQVRSIQMRSGQRPRSRQRGAAGSARSATGARARRRTAVLSAKRSSCVEPSARAMASSIVVADCAASACRSASVRPHHGARSTASHAVRSATMHQGTRQRDEVLHDRPIAQLFDLDRLKVDAGCRELACDRIRRACAR